jgi:hypothetical protein
VRNKELTKNHLNSLQCRSHLNKLLSRERLGTFNRQSKSTNNQNTKLPWEGGGVVPIPDELRQDAKSTGDTEQDGVEVHFLQSVMVQQDSGVGIDVGPWVLDFSEFVEDIGCESVYLRHEFE